tara:strand:+ start:728 stop:2128 length:1401 start_codon:yes stop_codon:yes gene_type:complete
MSSKSNYDTKSIWRKDKDHHIHPWIDFSTFKDEGSMIMSNSDGAYVFDSEGNKYIDGIGGLWCVNIGYGNEEMEEAIAAQLKELPYYTTFGPHTTPPAAELASKLATLTPGTLDKVFFGTGGSLANDTAVRIIHFYFNRLGQHNKKKIIARTDGYHGSTYLAMSMTGITFNHQGFDLAPDLVHHIPAPNPYRRPPGMTESEFCDAKVNDLENKITELGPENVACFIAEPIMGAGGVIVPPDGYHKRTKEVCDNYEVLYISDEVITGFGRLGHFFSSESVFNFVPDVITCAKGISSGYLPLSATILSDEMYDVISVPQSDGALFTHGFTYSGHPVSCAAGLKNIEIMERDRICEHVREVGPYFEEQLNTLLEHPIVGDVRGSHFMMCVECVADKETKSLLPEHVDIGKLIAQQCQSRGLFVRPMRNQVFLSPPLILTRQQIDTIVSILHESFRQIISELSQEGIYIN